MTLSPSRGVSRATSSSGVGTAASGLPSMSRIAASTRAWGLRDRAFAPRRSQASSRRARFRARRLGRRRPFLPLGPGLQVRPVSTLVHVRCAPVELEHPGGEPVEQVPVVGDQHQAAAEGEQPLLEPGHRAQVEMVGGLVEHQELRRVGQDPGQGHPLGLATRERRHIGRRLQTPCPGGRGRRRPPIPPRRPPAPSRPAARAPARGTRPASRGLDGPGPPRAALRRP